MLEHYSTNAQIVAAGEHYLYGNYGRIPLSLERGEGCYVFDKDGNRYLDFVGGIAVNGLGHGHPAVVGALQERMQTILHCSNYFYNEPSVQLAKLIVENTCFDKVLFVNSGAEANEALIKLARKYAKDHGHPERHTVMTMRHSFHGRTLATCAATGQDKIQAGFEPMPPGFVYAQFNDLASVQANLSDDVCAILVEPVQGEGGVLPATQEFLQGLRQLCDQHGILLLFDEVQVGAGRCGTLFAYQHYGVEPDAISMAKALGSGVPIGGIAVRGDATQTFQPGNHGTTFGGNPLATAVGAATIDTMLNGGVLDNCRQMGEYMRQQLSEVGEKYASVDTVRGLGLLNGMVLTKDGAPIVEHCRANHVLINCTAGSVLRFVPPLIVTKQEIDLVVAAVDRALAELGY